MHLGNLIRHRYVAVRADIQGGSAVNGEKVLAQFKDSARYIHQHTALIIRSPAYAVPLTTDQHVNDGSGYYMQQRSKGFRNKPMHINSGGIGSEDVVSNLRMCIWQ